MSKRFNPQIVTLPSVREPQSHSGVPFQSPEVCLEELAKLLDRKDQQLQKLSEASCVLTSLQDTVLHVCDEGLTAMVKQIAVTQQRPPELYPMHVNSSELLQIIAVEREFAYELVLETKLKPKLYRRRQFEY